MRQATNILTMPTEAMIYRSALREHRASTLIVFGHGRRSAGSVQSQRLFWWRTALGEPGGMSSQPRSVQRSKQARNHSQQLAGSSRGYDIVFTNSPPTAGSGDLSL